jgi:hypothetical protein
MLVNLSSKQEESYEDEKGQRLRNGMVVKWLEGKA